MNSDFPATSASFWSDKERVVAARLRRAVAVESLRVRGANRPDRADVAVGVVVPRMLSEQRAARLVAGLARGVTQARSGGCSAIAGCIKERNRTHIAADAFMLPPGVASFDTSAIYAGVPSEGLICFCGVSRGGSRLSRIRRCRPCDSPYSVCLIWLGVLISPLITRQGILPESLCKRAVNLRVSFNHDNFGWDAFSLLKPPKSCYRTAVVQLYSTLSISVLQHERVWMRPSLSMWLLALRIKQELLGVQHVF